MNITRGLIRSYDAHAVDRERRGEPVWRAPYRSAFAALLPRGGRVLEIGAGVGFTARWFADEGFDVLATDLSPANVALCREKGVRAEVRDLRELALPPATFDGVWAASCLMHVPDAELEPALAGIEMLLSDDGWFWAATWGGIDSEGVWEDDTYRPKRFYSFRSDARIRRFYEAAFTVVSFEVIDPEPDIEHHYQIALMQRRSLDSPGTPPTSPGDRG